MTFQELFTSYKEGKLNKAEYINAAYLHFHSPLFELASRIPQTAISSIEIKDDTVMMTFRDSGLRFKLNAGDKRLAPLDAINFADYEKSEMDVQFSLIKPGQIVYDIGANFGWYSLHLSHHFNGNLNIHSFEPVPSTFKLCKENIELNQGKGITLHPFGFSNLAGEMDVFFSPSLSVNASLQPLSLENDLSKVKCHFKTLDECVGDVLPIPDFIKCDVEGAEWLVFKGGERFFESHKPVVFAEMLRKWAARFQYHPNDMIQWFSKLGYICFGISSLGVREVPRVDDSTPETNYVFLHPAFHEHLMKYDRN